MSERWQGVTALVTGASGGVGLEIARTLAIDGARVLLPVRDRERGESAAARIRETAPDAEIEVRDLDLARMASVTALADQILAEATPIGLYVMNAGAVLIGDRARHVTEDGYELHFQTNFLGHFALTRAMLPLLQAGHARVAVQSSMASARVRLDWADLQMERRYSPMRAYGSSKVALGLFGLELDRRSAAEGAGVSVNLCHPGISPGTGIAADLLTKLGGGALDVIARHVGNPPATAALPALMALTADGASGRFFGPSGPLGLMGRPREAQLYRNVTDPAHGEHIWRVAQELLARRRR